MTGLPHGCALHHATPADLAAYAGISRRTFADTYAATHHADAVARHVAARFTDARLRAELEGAHMQALAVTHGVEWVGYALLEAGPAPDAVRGANPVEVARFYVDRAWHGRGIAAPLMDAALDAARGAGHDMAWLGVWEQNSRACRFYARRGFATVGRATYLFDGLPENDHVMAIVL